MVQRAPMLEAPIDDLIRAYEREGPFSISEELFLRLAFEDPNNQWELRDGLLVEKPGMSYRHGDQSFELAHLIRLQVDPDQYRIRVNHGHLRKASGTYLIPDVCVIPTSILGPEIDRSDVLEVYEDPLPFVVEVWSPSTGIYDFETKIPEYRARGDLGIWRVHPFERSVTMWRRRPDGEYDLTVVTGGIVALHALSVNVDLDALFNQG